MRVVKEADVPKEYATVADGTGKAEGDTDHIEFELLLRVNEASVQQQLRITAGPVRVNPESGQRESRRIDLGRCVRQLATDVVDDPRGRRVVRNRWWISIGTMRLVCMANSVDCQALDEPGRPPLEWVLCLADERTGRTGEAPPPAPEERRAVHQNVDELADFIEGKSGSSKKKRKKKNKDRGDGGGDADDAGDGDGGGASPLAALASALRPAAAGAPLRASPPLSASQAAAAALSGMPGGNPVAQAQVVAQLLAQAAALCGNPQQAAMAASAAGSAQRAAEAASGGPTGDWSAADCAEPWLQQASAEVSDGFLNLGLGGLDLGSLDLRGLGLGAPGAGGLTAAWEPGAQVDASTVPSTSRSADALLAGLYAGRPEGEGRSSKHLGCRGRPGGSGSGGAP